MIKILKYIKKYILYALVYPFIWLLSAVITFPVGVALVDYAYLERGYLSVGGEWFVILLLFYGVVKLFTTIGRWYFMGGDNN